MNFFKMVSIITSILFAYLFFQLLLTPVSFVNDAEAQSSEATSILCRRTSMFMLGLSVLLFSARKLPHSPARQHICLSTAITMIGLACMGSYELIRGTVNSSMLTAITIETILGTSFLILFFKEIMRKQSNL
jgi:hypothetical protein